MNFIRSGKDASGDSVKYCHAMVTGSASDDGVEGSFKVN